MLFIMILLYMCFVIAYRYDQSRIQSGIKSLIIFSIVFYRCFQISDEHIIDFYPRVYILALIIPFIVIKWIHLSSYCFHFIIDSIPSLPSVKDVWIETLSVLSLFLLNYILWIVSIYGLQILLFVFLLVCYIIQSYLGIIIIIVLTCMFWVLGIHGAGVLGTILRPFWLYMIINNNNFLSYLFLEPIHYIGTESFLSWFVWIDGSGATLEAVLWIRFFAKSNHLKKIGNESFLPSIYNINETVILGLPVVKNKHVMIPFILIPIIIASIAYFLMSFYYINKPLLIIPWVFPSLLGAFLVCMMDINTFLLSIRLIIISILIYGCFLKKYDKFLYKQEKEDI